MSGIPKQPPISVKGKDLERLLRNTTSINHNEVELKNEDGKSAAAIPITDANGDSFVLSAILEKPVTIRFEDKSPSLPHMNRLRFFIDDIYYYTLMSKGVDTIHIDEIVRETDGISEILVRYSNDGRFFASGHLLVTK